jgi:hypothetical protein
MIEKNIFKEEISKLYIQLYKSLSLRIEKLI